MLDAVWTLPGNTIADTQACRAPGVGACWALIAEKHRFILFGIYPFDQQWRPALVVALFIGLYIASANRRWWDRRLLVAWLAGLVAVLGGRGRHARAAVGTNALPMNMPVEIELVVEIQA